MIDEHQKFPHKSNEKYFLQKEVVQTKPSNPKSSQAVNNLFIKSDQKHQKTISLHKITNSLLNKEVEMSEESFSKPANKSSIGLPLNSYQFNQIINEKKKAFNEKIPKTYRYTDLSKSPDIKPPLSERPQLCKSCKENEENMKKISLVLNNMIYEIASLNQIENLWRNGNLSFENERIGSSYRNENLPPDISEDKEFLERDIGKICLKLQNSLWKTRIKFEDLILDVENLSKMSPFLEIELKENKDLSNINRKTFNHQITSPDKLMESIKEARNCLDILRGTVIKGQISESLLLEIRNLSKKPKNPNEILQTLRLQLEQSLRERRSLFIETSLLRKQMESQKLEGLDYLGLKKIIREIVENEIKSKKNIDASLSSSFNFNNL